MDDKTDNPSTPIPEGTAAPDSAAQPEAPAEAPAAKAAPTCGKVCPHCGEVHSHPEQAGPSFERAEIQKMIAEAIEATYKEKGVPPTISHKRRTIRALLRLAVARILAEEGQVFGMLDLLSEAVSKESETAGKKQRISVIDTSAVVPGMVLVTLKLVDLDKLGKPETTAEEEEEEDEGDGG